MNKTVIFIPIETASRELDYKIFLAIKLSLSGYKVVLATKYLINREIRYHRNYVYLDKGYHSHVSDDLYAVIKNRNGQILNLDEEGAVDFKGFPTLSNRYSKVLIDNASHVFFWGKEQMDHIEQLRGDSHKFVRTGHPRFQLLSEEFLGLYNIETEKIQMKYGEFILINTNFGFGNNLKGKTFVRQNYKSRIPDIDLFISEDEKKLKACIELVKILNSKYKIVIRPHPEENEDAYKKIASESLSIVVTKQYASIPWIMAASALVHIDCTTAVEAAILGKKVISYQPVDLVKSRLTVLPGLVSIERNNTSSVMRTLSIKNYQYSENERAKIENALKSFLSVDLSSDIGIDIITSKIDYSKITVKTSTYLSDFFWSLKLMIRAIIDRKSPIQSAKERGLNRKTIKAKYDYLTKRLGAKGKSHLSTKRGLYIIKHYEKN